MQKPPISYMTQLMQSAKVFILKSEPVSILIGGSLKGFVWTVKNVICHMLGSPHTFTPILPIHSVTIKSGNAKIKIEININNPVTILKDNSHKLHFRHPAVAVADLAVQKIRKFPISAKMQLSATAKCVQCASCEPSFTKLKLIVQICIIRSYQKVKQITKTRLQPTAHIST